MMAELGGKCTCVQLIAQNKELSNSQITVIFCLNLGNEKLLLFCYQIIALPSFFFLLIYSILGIEKSLFFVLWSVVGGRVV